MPNSGINLSYSNAGTIGTLDGEILLSLKEGHRPTEEFVTLLRAELPKRFPGIEFFFQPADIVTQILNFGLPAAIDVQFTGNNLAGNAALAAELDEDDPADPRRGRRARAPAPRQPGARPADGPHAAAADGPVGAQRRPERADRRCPAARRPRRRSGSIRRTASSTTIAVQTPQYRVDSLDALLNMPVAGSRRQRPRGAAPQLLGNLVEATAGAAAGGRLALQHHAGGRRLRERAGHRPRRASPTQVQKLVDEIRPKLPRGSQVAMRGQVQTMQASFIGLGVGLAMAIVLVYLLIVVNFQSWIDAAIIIAALPAALAGIAWMLFITGTTLSACRR